MTDSPLRDDAWMTVEEFLAAEPSATVRHELFGGWVRARSGGTRNHSLLAAAAVWLLRRAARAKAGCQAHGSDLLVRVGDSLFYPDAMATCSSSGDVMFETAPCVVVEVLSPSTAIVDRGAKRTAYTSIPSLQHYLVVHIDSLSVECYSRVGDRWASATVPFEGSVRLPCLDAELVVAELFADVVAT